jgi:lysophospholipase L1-like esterase
VGYKNRKVWNAVNDVARMIHEVDPNHPALTVIGDGFVSEHNGDFKEIAERCPDLDLLGINFYKGIEEVPARIRAQGWTKPYVITEWGPSGDWQVPRTGWKAAIEETSTEKAERYLERYQSTILKDTERCLGSYVFIWQWRHERTHTWYGMFLESGERTESVNVMQYLWTGRWPANRAPRIGTLSIDGRAAGDNVYLKPGSEHTAAVEATDPEGDPIALRWEVVAEVAPGGYAGMGEKRSKPMPELIRKTSAREISFAAPAQQGAYRVFVFAVDGQGNGATANIPFYVTPADQTLFDRYVGQLPPAPHEESFGARIQRTVSLLANSTAGRRRPVTILVYGQSITAGLRHSMIGEALKEKFPNADITFLNRSISGFSASQLARSLPNDVFPLYPDLVILHDLGASLPEYERMVENIRRYTTSEIMLCTDPFRAKEDVNAPPDANTDQAVIRLLAQQYGCELADVHEEWRAYMKAHNLAPEQLLDDAVHPNAQGRDVLIGMLLQHFRVNTLAPNDWMRTVRNYEAKRLPDEGAADGVVFTGKPWRFAGRSAIGETPGSGLKLTFTGNRVDCVLGMSKGWKPGTAAVRIDGKAPSTMNELWAFTTASPAYGADWQPAIRRITHRSPPVAETWKIVFSKLNEDASHFTFEVYGSKTGYDGRGEFDGAKYRYGEWGDLLDYTGSEPYPDVFVSNSGRVVIDYRDFKIPWARTYSKKPCPEGFEAAWQAIPLFTESLVSPASEDPSRVRLVTLAKGLSNGTHTLEIIPNGDGAVAVESIVVHEPPLR